MMKTNKLENQIEAARRMGVRLTRIEIHCCRDETLPMKKWVAEGRVEDGCWQKVARASDALALQRKVREWLSGRANSIATIKWFDIDNGIQAT